MALETENNEIERDRRGEVTEGLEGKNSRILGEEKSQARDNIGHVIQEIRQSMEKSRQDLDKWAKSKDRCSLEPLIADLLIKFVTKATAVLNHTNHILVPSPTREDSFRIATPAEVAASIPEAMYEEWGLPGRCHRFVSQKYTMFVDLKTHRSYPGDRYELANILCPGGLWADSREREVLEPMFKTESLLGEKFEAAVEGPPEEET
ncbi:MAG: hypothetical protein Q9207_007182 [Kuettlingeria erythrocarpa]